MANKLEKDSEQFKDIRVTTTQKIWSYATGMMALCLIFAPHKNTIVPPIIVATGAAVSTAFVWRSDKNSKESLPSERLQQIEERLANLETIAGTSDLDLQARIKQLEST